MWSDNHRQCLAALLELRDRNRDAHLDLSGLGNVVVWWWAYWDGIVELPQVRKALRTWVRPQLGGRYGGARSSERIRRGARATVGTMAGPGAGRATRTEVAERLADLYWTDDQDGLSRLAADVRAVMDPGGTGRTVGSPLQPVKPDGVALGVEVILRAAHAVVADPAALTDDDYTFARAFLRQTWAEYHRDWRALDATALDAAFQYEQPGVALQMREASRSLLTVLGLRLADHANTAPPAEP